MLKVPIIHEVLPFLPFVSSSMRQRSIFEILNIDELDELDRGKDEATITTTITISILQPGHFNVDALVMKDIDQVIVKFREIGGGKEYWAIRKVIGIPTTRYSNLELDEEGSVDGIMQFKTLGLIIRLVDPSYPCDWSISSFSIKSVTGNGDVC